ncbi:MAG: hypothetical protein J5895_00155 [Alphaproteobacteria bacterium]|nr:hypothetical protein [Alphaproteobacteria bacterium]
MKLYHYAPMDNSVLQDGLLSISKNPINLKSYAKRAGSSKKEDIYAFLEKTFKGRSRAISCLTEPIKWKGNDAVLKQIVDRSMLFSFELDDLVRDGLLEEIWCKIKCGANGVNEKFKKIHPNEIDASPLSWEKCDSAKGLLFGAVRHYLLVVKGGVIPPSYLIKENKS